MLAESAAREQRVQEATEAQNATLNLTLARLMSTMEEQQRRGEADREQVESLLQQSERDATARTATGCESWVAEAQLARDIAESCYWCHPADGRRESRIEVSWRHAFWRALKRAMPYEMFGGVEDFDVKGVYVRLLSYNMQSAVDQISSLNASLTSLVKGTQPMERFLETIHNISAKLEVLKEPASEAQLKSIIRFNLIGDGAGPLNQARYKDVLSDLDRHPSYDLMKWIFLLQGAARTHGDLVGLVNAGSPTLGAARTELNTTLTGGPGPRRARKAASATDIVTPVEEELAAARMALEAAQARVRMATQKAHPETTAGGRPAGRGPRAERIPFTEEEIAQRRDEPCYRFLAGKCRYGDTCHRKHLNEAEAEAFRKERATRPDAAKFTAGTCHSWVSEGTCVFGAECRFAHPEKAKVHVLRARPKVICMEWQHHGACSQTSCLFMHEALPQARMLKRAAGDPTAPEHEIIGPHAAIRALALTSAVGEQSKPISEVRVGDVAILPEQAPPALRGEMAQIFHLRTAKSNGTTTIMARMCPQGPDDASASKATTQYRENIAVAGLAVGTFTVAPTHLVAHFHHLQRTGTYPSVASLPARDSLRHSLNAIFDTGASEFVTNHRALFDKLMKCKRDVLCYMGNGKAIICTH
jgi:hypothetical protein